jgi:hypothetical protein
MLKNKYLSAASLFNGIDNNIVQNFFVENFQRRPSGRWRRWEGNMKKDLRGTGCDGRKMVLTLGKDQWQAMLLTVMNVGHAKKLLITLPYLMNCKPQSFIQSHQLNNIRNGKLYTPQKMFTLFRKRNSLFIFFVTYLQTFWSQRGLTS